MVAALTYFLLLVNALSLDDYGVFVSILASALIISNGGTYGFLAPTFRALTEDDKDKDAYVGAMFVYALLWIPLTLLTGFAIYALLFADYATMNTVIYIIVAEAILMRFVGLAYDLNLATGRYGYAACVNFLSVSPRIVAVFLFILFGHKDLETWSWYFACASFAAFASSWVLVPRLKARFCCKTLFRGLKESFSKEGVDFIQSIQVELDKVIVLLFAGPAAAGIYSISMRVIYVVTEPIRSLFPLAAQHFIKNTQKIRSLKTQFILEAGLVISCLGAFVAVIILLNIDPKFLGENVQAGFAFFSLLPMVFATKLLPEYHKTVLYGAKQLHKALVVAITITFTKMLGIYLVATCWEFPSNWPLALNLLFLILYIQSLAATWVWALRETRNAQA